MPSDSKSPSPRSREIFTDLIDVAAVYGPQVLNAAYNLSVTGLRPGVYDLVAYPHRAATNTFEGAQAVRVTVW